uniref:Uncharacterized protein n=1 Tax=viral metagenome TaxID=1070528 RepID=A0A6M3IFJ0_9ZZZZ
MGVFEDFGSFGFKKKAETQQENSEKFAKIMERAHTERNAFINDLAGEGGAVVRVLLSNLADRVSTLIDQDPECQAYKKVLGDMYAKLKIPEKLSGRLAKIFEIDGAPKK